MHRLLQYRIREDEKGDDLGGDVFGDAIQIGIALICKRLLRRRRLIAFGRLEALSSSLNIFRYNEWSDQTAHVQSAPIKTDQ
ncbi:hypothetical protein [uncultured Rhodoblastus sp.]|uniref:hypothetical protein n=1 Tax=uncultured Rhodoblastus sp. TaxID=543037 RepID=UPI0025EE60E4|nr:hypothetical protein [uncultured Rhodoblastus sp.]